MTSDIFIEHTFGDLLMEPVRNGVYKSKEFHGRGCKVVNMGELFTHSRLFDVPMRRIELNDREKEKSLLREGDLLFARRSLVAEGAGKCSIVKEVNEPTTFESSIIRARPDPTKASSDYLFYYFSSVVGRRTLGTILRQVAVSGITGSDLVNLRLSVPPLRIQERVADFFSALDDKIELYRKMNATLEQIAQTLFKSWFIDFDPVKAKAAGRQPEGMNPNTAALFPSEFEESELGLIPKAWRVEPLDNVATFLNGLALQNYPAESNGEFLPVIKIAQLRKGSIQGSDKANRNIPTEYVVHDGDMLFSWSGSLEIVLWSGGEGALNQHLFKVSSSKYPQWFYYLWTKKYLSNFREIAAHKATTMGHIQRRHLTEAKTLIPPPLTLERMSEIFEPLFAKILNGAIEARELTKVRDALLPKLISGRLRIPDAETCEGGTS